MTDFKTIPSGTYVSWHYRSAIGHGKVTGVHKLGTSSANTLYSIEEFDHHVSDSGSKEAGTVYHYGSALTVLSHKPKTESIECKSFSDLLEEEFNQLGS